MSEVLKASEPFLDHTDSLVVYEVEQTKQRSEYMQPEKLLMKAILENAVHCFRKYSCSKSKLGKKFYNEAVEWIHSNDESWIFSFISVCENLGISPEAFRSKISKL
jgi:hypothetical protein